MSKIDLNAPEALAHIVDALNVVTARSTASILLSRYVAAARAELS